MCHTAMASWHLWVACKICQYLSLVDLLNYVCAVRPGGFANQLRDRLRPKKEAINKLCSDIASLPVIGRPTSAVTNLVVGQATSFMQPLLKCAVSRLPTDQVLLWSLATARCVKLLMDPPVPISDSPAASEHLLLTSHARGYDMEGSKLPSMGYAEERVARVFGELREVRYT